MSLLSDVCEKFCYLTAFQNIWFFSILILQRGVPICFCKPDRSISVSGWAVLGTVPVEPSTAPLSIHQRQLGEEGGSVCVCVCVLVPYLLFSSVPSPCWLSQVRICFSGLYPSSLAQFCRINNEFCSPLTRLYIKNCSFYGELIESFFFFCYFVSFFVASYLLKVEKSF